MESWYKVAAYMAESLASRRGVDKIDLLTLNKVMYFAQRESYIRDNQPLFDKNKFHAAKYGPVIIELKKRLNDDDLKEKPSEDWIADHRTMLDYVVEHYGMMSPYSLSALSHSEISWRNAIERSHSSRYERIYDTDIRIDALKVRIREKNLSSQPS